MSKSRKKLPTEPVTASIDSLSHDARGVAHIDGKAVFVDEALPGEEVEFIYTRRKRRYDEARLHRVIAASPDRVTPRCEHFGLCGGCSLQHLAADKQIALKQSQLLDNLERIGHVTPVNILDPLTGPVWGYRRKARLGVKYVFKKEKLLVGFREKRKSYSADLSSCPVLHDSVGARLTDIADVLTQLSIRDKLPQIEVAVSDRETALVIRHLEPLSERDKELLSQLGRDHDYLLFLQPGGLDSVAPLDGEHSRLHYHIPDHDIEMTFKPTQFTQVNTDINLKMIQQALLFLQPGPEDNILDLFCGMGNFTLPIARSAGQVTGIEGNDELIQLARRNAISNGLPATSFLLADLFDETQNGKWTDLGANKVLLDPPRSGALNVVEQLDRKQLEKIVYVSCNPSTLARDADVLVNHKGFRLTHAGVMDMFPHTSHVEAIAVFEN